MNTQKPRLDIEPAKPKGFPSGFAIPLAAQESARLGNTVPAFLHR
jgi:hypothetical protein